MLNSWKYRSKTIYVLECDEMPVFQTNVTANEGKINKIYDYLRHFIKKLRQGKLGQLIKTTVFLC